MAAYSAAWYATGLSCGLLGPIAIGRAGWLVGSSYDLGNASKIGMTCSCTVDTSTDSRTLMAVFTRSCHGWENHCRHLSREYQDQNERTNQS